MTDEDEERPTLHLPEPRTREETVAELESGDGDRIKYALIDGSYYEDVAWLQARCLEALPSPFPVARYGALMALQILVCLRGGVDPLVVVPAVAPLLDDPDGLVVESAMDVLKDIKRVYGQ